MNLQQRMRYHIQIRGGLAKDENGKPVLPNGAWQMMLEAANTLDDLRRLVYIAVGGWLITLVVLVYRVGW